MTTQYLFSCQHAATHRFRNDVCELSKLGDCHIKDTNRWLPFSCRRCASKKLGRWRKHIAGFDQSIEALNDVWYVPSRCFVDVGFSNPDPFKASCNSEGKVPCTTSPESSPTTQMPHSTCSESPSGCTISPNRLTQHKNPRLCCEATAKRGAFQAVRLEGRGDRVEGRICENHCKSID